MKLKEGEYLLQQIPKLIYSDPNSNYVPVWVKKWYFLKKNNCYK